LIKIILFGLVQTKPVQSKTASLGPGPVRPSGETGPDQALPQTRSVRTGGIIDLGSVIRVEESARLDVSRVSPVLSISSAQARFLVSSVGFIVVIDLPFC
jgi:hypothetical protein